MTPTVYIVPMVYNIRRRSGIAGQFCYTATVQYPGEAAQNVLFIGTVWGPAVVLVSDGWPDGIRVIDPERYGAQLSPEWINNFYAPDRVGYICKQCERPSPLGVGYVDSSDMAYERSYGLTECSCGYSVREMV
jgi:hypothetical protein